MVTGLTKIWAGVNDTVTELATAGASLPSGLIAIWKGLTSTIPDGWALCDGSNGTPDLRDKFVLGAGNSYSVGNTGGEETHTLTVEEMPSHSHSYAKYQRASTISTSSSSSRLTPSSSETYTGLTGGNQPHNNMPPYYALCYIMKT